MPPQPLGEREQTLVLPDGRALGWATYGDPEGVPVVALHGAPDSHVIWRLVDDAARRHGLHVVAPDRPGFGLSDPHPGRRVVDWPADLVRVVDHLGIDRFPVVAISGGGAFAVATAWKLAERVQGVALFSVIGPLDVAGATVGMNRPVRATYALARRAPWLLALPVQALARSARRDPQRAGERLLKTRPAADRAVMQRPEVWSVLIDNIPNQFAHPQSVVDEFRLAVEPWGVPFDEVRVPVELWQGGRDDVHTPVMARHLHAVIAGSVLHYEPEFATFTFLDHLDPMLDVLSRWAQA